MAHSPGDELPLIEYCAGAGTFPARRWIRYDDWSCVLGQEVEIRRGPKTVRRGRVDMVSEDSSILWIAGDHAQARALYIKDDGYGAWVSPPCIQTTGP